MELIIKMLGILFYMGLIFLTCLFFAWFCKHMPTSYLKESNKKRRGRIWK